MVEKALISSPGKGVVLRMPCSGIKAESLFTLYVYMTEFLKVILSVGSSNNWVL